MNTLKNADFLKDCVKARHNFLKNGFYDNVSNKLNELILKNNDKFEILDSGCGPGYYGNRLFEYLKFHKKKCKISGFDISKEAIKEAKKSYKNIDFVVGDVFNIPAKNNSKDIIINIFVPKCFSEYKRVLKKNGKLYIVTAEENGHFSEIYKLLNITKKKNLNKLYKNLLDNDFQILSKEKVKYKVKLNKENIENVIKTIPYHLQIPKEKIKLLKEKVKNLELSLNFLIVEAGKKTKKYNNCPRVAGVIFNKKNKKKIAIIYNPIDKKYSILKGHIDDKENSEECLKRESLEEMGLKIKIIKKIYEGEIKGEYNPKIQYNLILYIAEALNDKIYKKQRLEKHLSLKWVNYEDAIDKINYKTLKQIYKKCFKEIKNYAEG